MHMAIQAGLSLDVLRGTSCGRLRQSGSSSNVKVYGLPDGKSHCQVLSSKALCGHLVAFLCDHTGISGFWPWTRPHMFSVCVHERVLTVSTLSTVKNNS